MGGVDGGGGNKERPRASKTGPVLNLKPGPLGGWIGDHGGGCDPKKPWGRLQVKRGLKKF